MEVETSRPSRTAQLYRSLRSLPADLLGVVGVLGLVNLFVLVPGLREASLAGAPLRTLLGVPALLFLPGYVLVALAFPARATRVADDLDRQRRRVASIDLPERLALSFGMSVAILPLYGLAMGTWWTVTPSSVLTSLSVLLLVGVGLAAFRRLRLQPADRFGTSVAQLSARTRRTISTSERNARNLATLLLVLTVLVAVGAMGFAVATPGGDSGSSTLYLVTENETGAALASGYPTSITAGNTTTLTVGIENDEERLQSYTVAVELERVATDGVQPRVLDSRSVTRLHPTVPAGESWTGRHEVVPRRSGQDLRLHYYLYRGSSAPPDPDPESAYREAYLWLDVEEA